MFSRDRQGARCGTRVIRPSGSQDSPPRILSGDYLPIFHPRSLTVAAKRGEAKLASYAYTVACLWLSRTSQRIGSTEQSMWTMKNPPR